MNISYSAPAKVILSGEHSVVYGKPALVSAINLRLNFSVTVNKSQVKNFNKKSNKNIPFIINKVKDYLLKKKIKPRIKNNDFNINITSQIPQGVGLGSSAAFSVSAVATFLEFFSGRLFDKESINQLAYQVEHFFHKNPSGVDNSASCFGGLVYYRKEFDFLKNISILNFKIPKRFEKKLFLVDSGCPGESTKEMIDFVGSVYNKKPRLTEEIFNEIEKITKKLVISILKEDEKLFSDCLARNQFFLEKLGIVSSKAIELLRRMSEFGVGKITGAGGLNSGSGFVVFFSDNHKKLTQFLREKKIKYYKFIPDYQGLIRL